MGTKHRIAAVVATGLAGVLGLSGVAGAAPGDQLNIVSVKSNGATTRGAGFLELGFNGNSEDPAITADGRYVAFSSWAGDLVANDTNFVGALIGTPKGSDIFRHDRLTGETIRVSLKNNQNQINGANSLNPQISADGATVVFDSDGGDIGPTPPGGGGRPQVYLRNVIGNTTTPISNPFAPTQGLGDLINGPAGSRDATMNDAATVIAFTSDDQLVPEDNCDLLNTISGNCSVTDTYVWRAGQPGYQWLKGAVNAQVSRNGEWIVFQRAGQIVRRNLATNAEIRVDVTGGGESFNSQATDPSISDDGNVVVMSTRANNILPGDNNGVSDIYVRLIAQNQYVRVSVSEYGTEYTIPSGPGVVSANGLSVAFVTGAPLLPVKGPGSDVIVHDLLTGAKQYASQNFRGGGAGGSTNPVFNADGTFVAFESSSQALVDSDTNGNQDVYLWDRNGIPAPLAIGPLVFAAGDGGVFTYGGAAFFGSLGGTPLNEPITGLARTESGNGYWLVASDGGVFAFGDAQFYGSLGAVRLNQPIVGMARTESGNGYFLVAADGGVFTFGDAQFAGSTGGLRLNQPIVGMAAHPNGGYYLVASDGGIFAFGGAPFLGSTGGLRLIRPINGMTATPGGGGYYLVADDGGVFTFGDAAFFGSAGGTTDVDTVGLAINPKNNGYRLIQSSGTVLSFTGGIQVGGANTGGQLNAPVVAVG